MTEYVAVGDTVYEQMIYDGTNVAEINSWLAEDTEAFKGANGKLYVVEDSYGGQIVRSFYEGQTIVGRVSYGLGSIDGSEPPPREIHVVGDLTFGYRLVERAQVPGSGNTTTSTTQ